MKKLCECSDSLFEGGAFSFLFSIAAEATSVDYLISSEFVDKSQAFNDSVS